MKSYVLVGASGRALGMYARPLVKDFSDCAKVAGIFDVNPLRAETLKKEAGLDCKIYTDFDQMMTEQKPDSAIVTTVDRFHHEYIIKCLEAGAEVITEKPMTIDSEKCNAILEAEARTGKKVIVTFNYRFAPYVTAVKQAIADGLIGDVLNVDFEYMLDTSHGADYFRRWHRKKENSGGLLVHKSTHHFDLINWWIMEEPVEVMGYGTRRFYGPTRKERGERCLTCNYKNTCEFYFNIDASDMNHKMYHNCESADGYFRDRCVFADEINIEDSMSVNVKYSKGTLLSYSLIAHSPYEGYKASISGTNGRLEIAEYHSGIRTSDSCYYFNLYNRKGQKIEYSIPKATGGHGGGDVKLRNMIFRGGIPDPLGHQAGSFAGAISILIGISANKSIAEGKNIKVNDLVDLAKYRK
ncbi:MAG TPA: gfo/Idh/MocA family oxidoreductase [Armatimonadetes bacterium]|nr:gfo/Idh/MocA family oxidoreductase [Armatimonadota bacterium]